MSQKDRILNYLLSGRRLTPLQALKRFGCLRLGARVYELREEGHAIEMDLVEDNGKWFARYSLLVRKAA